jgi:hypothetical protein
MFDARGKLDHDLTKKFLHLESAKTDNLVFRLHYKLSIAIVLLANICYLMMVHNRDHISCVFPAKTNSLGTKDDQRTFCWILGFYTLEPDNDEERLRK